jgi:ketosteroid isomerase-like protein
MRRFVPTLILTLAVAAAGTAGGAPEPWRADAAVVAQLAALAQAWDTALVKADLPTLEKILGDEYVEIDEEGLADRAAVLEMTRSGEYKAQSLTVEDLNVRVYGGTAVLTGRLREKSAWRGKDHSRVSWLTDLFVQRDGRWQCVLTHTTPVP